MKTNYGNWISTPMMKTFCFITVLFYALSVPLYFIFGLEAGPFSIALILGIAATLVTLYMLYCRYVFSFDGGGLMGRIHVYLLDHLPWDGRGTVLDVGCGAGALSIACAKRFPEAHVAGMDYWPAMWGYAKEQCEQNAQAEGVAARCTFQHGDAAKMDFPDAYFDAVISNFVFHEVRTQKDKFLLVQEALRTLKPGGVFALHDTFGNRDMYGDMDEFVAALEESGISEITYVPHTEQQIAMPPPLRIMMRGIGLLYGRK